MNYAVCKHIGILLAVGFFNCYSCRMLTLLQVLRCLFRNFRNFYILEVILCTVKTKPVEELISATTRKRLSIFNVTYELFIDDAIEPNLIGILSVVWIVFKAIFKFVFYYVTWHTH